jgi:hypothetical protein
MLGVGANVVCWFVHNLNYTLKSRCPVMILIVHIKIPLSEDVRSAGDREANIG